MNMIILLPILLPILAGVILLCLPKKQEGSRTKLLLMTGVSLILSFLSVVLVLCCAKDASVTVFSLIDGISLAFHVDMLGGIFAAIAAFVLLLAGFFSFSYFRFEEQHEKAPRVFNRFLSEQSYYGFYLITFGVLVGLDFAANLVTMYLFYEFMTLVTVLLVIHNGTREAVMAGLKYLFYSFAGAYMALFGIYFLAQILPTLDFVPQGSLVAAGLTTQQQGLLLICVFLMILGFGVKAGMFPFHAWLSTAHPVAPAPASAILSGIIVKGGVLAMIRVVYYLVGTQVLAGTWVQTAWLSLAIVTIVMGSALAYKEHVLKKRLAYSTISNLSYIMFGLALFQPAGMTGALLHVIFHAIMKAALFLCAGAIIATTGKTKVEELDGMGRRKPVLFWCFTIASLGLIGIPPTSGVVSKWYLAVGALDSGIVGFSWIGVVALLLSALLTAGYLLPVSIRAFLGKGSETTAIAAKDEGERDLCLMLPIVILTVLVVLLGVFAQPLCDSIFNGIASECIAAGKGGSLL